MDALKKEKEERERAALTFRPRLVRGGNATEIARNPAKSTIHERLYREADAKKKKKGNNVHKKEKRRHSSGTSKIFERLNKDHARKQRLIEKREQEKINRELADCTFQPKISKGLSRRRSR